MITANPAESAADAKSRRPALQFDPALRATLGCIQLPTDLTLDEEGPALMARVPDVRLRLQKVALDGERLDLENYSTGRGRIEQAARSLRPGVDVIGLACTSLAFTLGIDAVQAELKAGQPGAKVTDMATAALAALEWLGARRLAILTPYLDELHDRNLELFRSAGYEVVADHNLGLATDAEITAISQESLMDCAIHADHADADVLFLGCSAFRACTPGFLDTLEERLGKPVLSSQQAFLWHLLRLAGIQDSIGGYGSLLAERHTARDRTGETVAIPAHTAGSGQDVYPSRVENPGLVWRADPVVDAERRFSGPLNEAKLEQFDRRGYLILRQVFSPSEVKVLKKTVDDLRAEYEALTYEELDRKTDMRVITERGGALVQGEDESPILKSIWQIHLPPEHAPHMLGAAELSRRAVCDSRLVDAARQLIGEEVYIHQSRINFQQGWSDHSQGGSGFLWHQDFEQWHCEDGMPRMRAVSMALLLEPAVPANGALMVMPGSHRQMIQARAERDSDRYTKGALSKGPTLPAKYLHQMADEYGIIHCRGEAGDVVIFDCNIVHGSHTNISPWSRAMFFGVYNAVSNIPAEKPFASETPRPEHIGSRDPRFAGVPLPSLPQTLTAG